MTRRLVKRIQRKAMGGMVYGRVYSNGDVRIRTDHPSNDPAVEMAMAAYVIGLVRAFGKEKGVEFRVSGPMHWHDDPPRASA
jgi:hypothetical protein